MGDVQFPLQLEEDVEQPGAVVAQQLPLHDEHVEVVAVGLGHIQVVGGQVLGTFAGDDGPGDLQVLLVVGMDVLGVVGLDIIVPLLGQNDVGGGQDAAQLLMPDDPLPLGGEAVLAAGEVAAVVDKADVVGVDVLPGPVQAGEFAEIPVAVGDVFAGVVAHIADVRVDGMAHLYRQIHGIVRHPVGLMRRYDDLRFQLGSPLTTS